MKDRPAVTRCTVQDKSLCASVWYRFARREKFIISCPVGHEYCRTSINCENLIIANCEFF